MKTILFFLVFYSYGCSIVPAVKNQKRLLMISLDGFRHDYIERYNLKNFKSFLENEKGSRAAFMNPQFTTQTFPNHWSIVTGSYVEKHGIVANSFYDPLYNETFSRSSENYSNLKWWNATEPIWFKAVNKGLKTAAYFWPGSDTLFSNSTLYKRLDFNKSITFDYKIDQVIDWFINENFTFVCLYHHEPDAVAHRFGMDTIQFNETINQIDISFGYLIEKLKENDLFGSQDFNLIVVSDHGMANIRKHIILDDYINGSDFLIWSETGNLVHFKPLIKESLFFDKIKKIPNTKAFIKKDIPKKLNYRENNRISDIILIADEGVGMILMYNKTLRNGKQPPVDYEQRKKAFIKDSEKASHGYDQIYPSMRGIFLVYGSDLKKNYQTTNYIENIDVYPLICHLLNLICQKRDGSLERVAIFLNKAESLNFSMKIFIYLVIIFLFLI